ncbi:FAD-binding oxidoreductase [Candidatus Parcubacteria bacterium]|nr:FAD-binding oxidoreductase [Candidatus Parcubacteria bacterium]
MKWPLPYPEVYWYTLKSPKVMKLDEDLVFDVVIIGGGMAGLMCAQRIKRYNKNVRVAIIESSVCGGGASGKSSGFITPDSELELTDLVEAHGEVEGKRIWEFAKSGVESIRKTIEQRSLNCDYSVQDSLYIANTFEDYKDIAKEWAIQKKLGYDAWLYRRETLGRVIGSADYQGAVRSKGTFGIISFLYCQELKESLIRDGIPIYEHTPVLELSAPYIRTNDYTIEAEKIIICTDRFLPKFHMAKDEVYHAQTFLAVSAPLPRETIQRIFPGGPMMVWDSDLIYQYYRMVEGNRLLIGASSLIYTYARQKKTLSKKIVKKMYSYLEKKFPDIPLKLDYFWPGLIGVSKDFLPIIGMDPVMKNVYFTGAGAGLPWAAALGEYTADKIFNGRSDFDKVFSYKRKFPIGHSAQVVLSKPLSFALSHGIKKYI